MRCFYHPDRDAVGLCGSCLRGICAECAKDIGKSQACAGHCEDDVAIDEASVPTQEKLTNSEAEFRHIPGFLGYGGLLVLSWSAPAVILLHNRNAWPFVFLGVFPLVIAGLIVLHRARTRRRPESERQPR